MKAKPIIVALDVDTRKEAGEWVDRLQLRVDIFKVGLQLFTREGWPVVDDILQRGKRVFIDLKLHDIPNTVAQSVRSLARPGVDFITLHASGGAGMMSAASDALRKIRFDQPSVTTRLLAVTVLTSLDGDDLRMIGIDHTVQGQVLNLARLAKTSGMDGVVSSPHEVRLIRTELGDDFTLVTPGVRLESGDKQDQKRVMTPADAIREGSNFLVMGRSLLMDPHPESLLDKVFDQIPSV